MARPKKTDGTGAPVRADGRRAMLTYMRPELIIKVKKAALDRDTTAFWVMEQAAKLWLETQAEKTVEAAAPAPGQAAAQAPAQADGASPTPAGLVDRHAAGTRKADPRQARAFWDRVMLEVVRIVGAQGSANPKAVLEALPKWCLEETQFQKLDLRLLQRKMDEKAAAGKLFLKRKSGKFSLIAQGRP